MDPIKVDFSDSGKKKSVKDVLIPPEKAGLKIASNAVVIAFVSVLAHLQTIGKYLKYFPKTD